MPLNTYKFTLAILAALMVTLPATFAAPVTPAFEQDLDKIDDVNPYVIKAVIVDGYKLIPRSQVKAVIKTKPGDFYHRKDMEQDLKAIYNLGYYSPENLHVEAHTTSAGMVINIHVKENPLFKSIAFEGNKIEPTAKLEELFKEQLLKPQSSTQLATAIKKINEMYKAQGYLLVSCALQKDDPSGKIVLKIDEGTIKEIQITCPSEEQKSIVDSALTLKAGDVYNEKKMAADLKIAFKLGKFDNLEREVEKDKSGGYIVHIISLPKEKVQKTAAAPILKQAKAKSTLPVLNKLIHSPLYKNIKAN